MRNLGTCERVMARLSDYLDEDLDEESGVEVEKHLRGCGTCQAFADSLRQIIELCRAYEPGVKPRALTPSARAELESAWQKTLADRQSGSNRGT
jgi:predicted anti-sigma-YlaC factor YlaD